MENNILKYLNELGGELEKGYGCKLIILEEKDFNINHLPAIKYSCCYAFVFAGGAIQN